jgi:hypothetical protein
LGNKTSAQVAIYLLVDDDRIVRWRRHRDPHPHKAHPHKKEQWNAAEIVRTHNLPAKAPPLRPAFGGALIGRLAVWIAFRRWRPPPQLLPWWLANDGQTERTLRRSESRSGRHLFIRRRSLELVLHAPAAGVGTLVGPIAMKDGPAVYGNTARAEPSLQAQGVRY